MPPAAREPRYRAWAAAELFFVAGVALAVCFAILSARIAAALALDDAGLGLLSGVFFAAYAAGQLGFGILLGRVPPRLLLGLTALLAALGTAAFALADGLGAALVARALTGLGLSSSFVGVIHIVGRDHPGRFAFLSTLSQSLANLAAAALSLAAAVLAPPTGFRGPFAILAALLLAAAALAFLLIGPGPARGDTASRPPLRQALRETVASGAFWAALVFYCGTFGTLLAFADLWNIQFQLDFFHHGLRQGALLNATIPLGVTLGGLVAGAWAGRSGFVVPARAFALLLLAGFLVLLAVPLPAAAAAALLFVVGAGFSASTLGLAALQRHLSADAASLATSLVVTAAFLFGGALQPLVGTALVGAAVFGTYQKGLLGLLTAIAAAVAASFFFRPGIGAPPPDGR